MKSSPIAKDTWSLYKNVYAVALPLIFSACLGNILEVVDLTISSLVDFEIVKAISFLERFRFFFGAILIGFTATLSMYLNRLLPKEDHERPARIFRAIRQITLGLGLIFSVGFALGIYFLSEPSSPTQVYGLGTAINIFVMYASTPLYILLLATKKTKNILKVGLWTTLFNILATWFLAKQLELGTLGVIAPTVVANIISYGLFKKEAQSIELIKIAPIHLWQDITAILKYVKQNLIGSVSICLSELVLVVVALQFGDIGVLYGVFFAFEKLFNAITHAISNAGAIHFSEFLHRDGSTTSLKPFLWLCLTNSAAVVSLSYICLKFYDRFLDLNPFLLLILGIILCYSVDYFFRKVILRPAGDAEWTKATNLYLIALGNFVIAGSLLFIKDEQIGTQWLFSLLLVQALASVFLVLRRVQSRRWYNEI